MAAEYAAISWPITRTTAGYREERTEQCGVIQSFSRILSALNSWGAEHSLRDAIEKLHSFCISFASLTCSCLDSKAYPAKDRYSAFV